MSIKTSEKAELRKSPSKTAFTFERTNYIIMLAGVAVLLLGFLVMTMDTEPHGFGILGLSVGPVIVMLGFLIQFAAIMYKTPRKEM